MAYYIYALLYRNEIVYIGQSTSLITRLAAHVNSNKVFGQVILFQKKFNAIERMFLNLNQSTILLRSKPKSKKEKKYEKIYKRIRAKK